MSRIDTLPRFPADLDQTVRKLTELFRAVALQLNGISEGSIVANYSARTSIPTTGTWKQGDMLRNTAPEVQGTFPWQYVVFGWICVESGTPGTWQEIAMSTTISEQQETMDERMSSLVDLMSNVLIELRVLTFQIGEGFGSGLDPERLRRDLTETVEH